MLHQRAENVAEQVLQNQQRPLLDKVTLIVAQGLAGAGKG